MPYIDDKSEAINEWNSLNKSVNNVDAEKYKTPIYSIRSQHNGKSNFDRVGDPCSTNGKLVVAIIESASMYSVIAVGSTCMVSKNKDVRVDYFEVL